jgi:hypothetical protein
MRRKRISNEAYNFSFVCYIPTVKKADARGSQALGFIFSLGVAASFVLLILGVVYLRM